MFLQVSVYLIMLMNSLIIVSIDPLFSDSLTGLFGLLGGLYRMIDGNRSFSFPEWPFIKVDEKPLLASSRKGGEIGFHML